ncbi:PadR family transcriptional regulator [Arthrobacter cheniae]|uniref:PadR family transcriptional regulator n=1 Tax=Arthrobacter cheniae TaxID=1258888 RepID=UPI001C7E14CE|nr:PadR family transcriptional regulator [Arthrobacter cheniae]
MTVPRSDQSQTAILGALSIMPMTGYALREEIRDTLGHFWSESFGQIYPALAELERNRLVERRQVEGSRSSTFSLTDAGIAHLRGLLAEAPQPSKPRNGLMLRLFFGAQLGPEACKQLVLDAREQAESTLTHMEAARSEVLHDPDLVQAAPYILLTITAGEHSARATIAWANEALAQLSDLETPRR